MKGIRSRPRLEHHYANKDFWTKAVFFVTTAANLHKGHVQFLEARLIACANLAKRVPLDNSNTPSRPTLSEAEIADMEVFLQNLLTTLPVIGIHAFEQPTNRITVDAGTAPGLLTCRGKGVVATGLDTTQGLVVKAQSGAVGDDDEVPSMAASVPTFYRLRRELVANGVLQPSASRYLFAQDHIFGLRPPLLL